MTDAATPTVMTVRGPIPAADLGFTLTHEHPYCRLRQAPHRYDFPDQVEDDELIASEVGAFVELGGRSMVDLTTPQIGRQPAKLVALSERVGINIVMGCGWYRESYYLPEERLDQRQVDDLADGLITEIEGGCRAGAWRRPGPAGRRRRDRLGEDLGHAGRGARAASGGAGGEGDGPVDRRAPRDRAGGAAAADDPRGRGRRSRARRGRPLRIDAVLRLPGRACSSAGRTWSSTTAASTGRSASSRPTSWP